jgi:hypothetical protein
MLIQNKNRLNYFLNLNKKGSYKELINNLGIQCDKVIGDSTGIIMSKRYTSSLISQFNKNINKQRTDYYVEADGTKKSISG